MSADRQPLLSPYARLLQELRKPGEQFVPGMEFVLLDEDDYEPVAPDYRRVPLVGGMLPASEGRGFYVTLPRDKRIFRPGKDWGMIVAYGVYLRGMGLIYRRTLARDGIESFAYPRTLTFEFKDNRLLIISENQGLV